MRIEPATEKEVTLEVPGSKSITHRALIMSSLAEGTSYLVNPLDCEDTSVTAEVLRQLGADIAPLSTSMAGSKLDAATPGHGNTVDIFGHSSEYFHGKKIPVTGTGSKLLCPKEKLFLGDSGTSMRFFTALVVLGRGRYYLTGSDRLRERPVGPLVAALKNIGVEIVCRNDNYPPVEVRACGFPGGEILLDASKSSQYLSALLLVSPFGQRETVIRLTELLSSRPYVDITVDIMRDFGAQVEWVGDRSIRVSNKHRYQAREFTVEGDCSSAAYFWAAAAILGSRVTTKNINPLTKQGDINLLDVLEKMGCRVFRDTNSITVEGESLMGMEVSMNVMPDQVPTLAVVAAFAKGRTVIKDVSHLRIKESDRLSAVAQELARTGISVTELDDGLIIEGGTPGGATIETYNDHRIAMAFAILGLRTPGIKIKNPACVNKSFSRFWDMISRF